jgi:vitamin B12 transporter
MKKLFLFFFCNSVCLFCQAQKNLTDSTHHISEVQVSANRLQHFSLGSKVENIDTSILKRYSPNTLADLLSSESQVFIRSYGIGSLASPSFRGTSASQTAVLWNGFNLSGPTNGQLDFALVPIAFLDNVKLQFGGSGALWGSGAVGGTVHLSNTSEFDKGLILNTGLNYGSFGDKEQNIGLTISKKRFITSTRIFNHDAKNDFPFINTAQFGKPEQKLLNAELTQHGLLQENYFKINEVQKLSLRFWYQFNDRNIPASMTEGKSQANQKDEFYRSALEWQLDKEKISVFVRTAYFDEYIKYIDPSISLISNNHTKSFIAEAESKIRLSDNHTFNFGINNTHNSAFAKDYLNNPVQNKIALFGCYRINNKKQTIRGTTTFRQEFVSNGIKPFTASAGIESWPLKKIRLRGNAAKTYRLPTFNDLYWTPGGNPDLLPESGFSQELGLAIIHFGNKLSLEAEASAFSNKVDNWIIWLPNNLGNYTPQNILSVWSRGIEYDLKNNYNLGKINLSIKAKYQFIFSTNEKISEGGDISSLHKQLIYSPAQRAQGSLSADYEGFSFSFSCNYVGYSYTIADNSQYLKPHQIGNLYLGKEFGLTNMRIKTFVQINNIWKETYQIIAYRPMPGRYYQVGLSINYNQPNKK